MFNPSEKEIGDDYEKLSYIEKLYRDLSSIFESNTYNLAIQKLMTESTKLNNIFVQGRGRIAEMQVAIADTIPKITRLGGDVGDAMKTMGEIAMATRRNTIETEQTVTDLYAANKILGTGVQYTTDQFIQAGYAVSNVGKEIYNTISYVQSLGLNAKEITKDVVDNMDKMNRFQFEGGINGLTKMAAQASLLKVDMSATFNFADRLLSPENAIQVSSAFQRLGVTAGDLVNPFAMMNKSILDPNGLQDSLAKMASSFVEFNKEAGRFQLNPEAVLRFKEMEEQAQLQAGTLTKMGIGYAEIQERMKQVSQAGLTFENEEDAQFLANISRFEGGVLKVTLEDNTKVELTELNQEQFTKIMQRERDRPKTLEDLAKSQLTLSETVMADVRTLRDKIVFGTITLGPLPELTENLTRVTKGFSKTFALEGDKPIKGSDIRELLTGIYKDFEEVLKKGGDMQTNIQMWENETSKELIPILGGKLDDLLDNFNKNMKGTILDPNNNVNSILEAIQAGMKVGDDFSYVPTQPTQRLGESFIKGMTPLSNTMMSNNTSLSSVTSKGDLDVDMNLTITHTISPEFGALSSSNQNKLINEFYDKKINSTEFKQFLFDSWRKMQGTDMQNRNNAGTTG